MKSNPTTPQEGLLREASTPKEPAATAVRKTHRKRRSLKRFDPQQKVQAVLAIWMEKLNQSEVCRELDISYMTLQGWQKRAMEGMMQALESNVKLKDGAALSPRLRKLMEDQGGMQPATPTTTRLKSLQRGRPEKSSRDKTSRT